MRRPVAISLFTGTGGLDLGLSAAGYNIRLQIDMDKECCETLRRNKQRYWQSSTIIEDKIENWKTLKLLEAAGLKEGEAALVFGGPPCQPFSKSAFWSPLRWADRNRRRPSSNRSRSVESFRGLDDPRAGLLREFVRVVQDVKPTAYLIENVFGLAYKTSRPMLDALRRSLKQAGYSFNAEVLNAADYGIPQKRERLFIIGARDRIELFFPEPTHCDKSGANERLCSHKPYVTAGQAIGDLDDGKVEPEEEVRGKWGNLLPLIPPGGNYLFFTKKMGYPKPIFKWRSKYWSFLLKLSPNKPSWTIQAQPGPHVGPFHWANRRLRISEIKRLQTFPDDYEIYGDRRSAQRQLGDAVPPLLAQRLGEAMKMQLSQDQTARPALRRDL